MESGKKGSVLGEIALFAASAVVFFRVSLFLPIFVIPLTVLYRRRDFYSGLVGSAIALGGIAGIKIFEALFRGGGPLRMDLLGLDLTMPLGFILGLVLMELPRLSQWRLHHRLLAVTLVAMVLSIPLLGFVLYNPEFDEMLRTQLALMFQNLSGGSDGQLLPFKGMEEMVRLSRYWFLNTYAAGFFVTFAINWVLGSRIGRRTWGLVGEFPAFSRFRMEEPAVWPFLFSWAAVFASLVGGDIGYLRALAWNCALILTVLFGCQGVGIIRTLTAEMARGMKFMLNTFLVLLIFIPGLNALVLAGVPLLGVSELWINYRNKERR